MTHVFVNGLGASAGGGLTYLRNVVPQLATAGARVTVAINSEFQRDSAGCANVEYVHVAWRGGALRRSWLEQKKLPGIIQRCGADLLLSAGNFALRNSPVPQILLSRNSLYTCPDFYLDLIARGQYRLWLETRIKAALARRSVKWADRTIAPSMSFARELERWTDRPVAALHHGFDHERFVAGDRPAEEITRQLTGEARVLRILLVSHYNYFRNFETVFRAISKLRDSSAAPEVRLFLTCELRKARTPGDYNPEPALRLIEQLGIRGQVIELGAVPYGNLHYLYRACDVYVTAAYTETFAHPLVEAMSCGLPVVASDLAVHREICGDAAVYFPRFSAEELAAQLAPFAAYPGLRREIGDRGLERSRAFSWTSHVKSLLALADELVGTAGHRHITAAVNAA